MCIIEAGVVGATPQNAQVILFGIALEAIARLFSFELSKIKSIAVSWILKRANNMHKSN